MIRIPDNVLAEDLRPIFPKPINMATALVDPPELAPEVIRNVLRRGHKLSLSGPSKAGKSWCMIELAAAVSVGGDWLGFECTRGRVFIVNCEISYASFINRVMILAPRVNADFSMIDVLSLRGYCQGISAILPTILEHLGSNKYSLCIIDPIYRLIEGNENDATETTRFLNQLERIPVESGAALAFVNHFSKGLQGGKNPIDRASGSGVWARDPDSLLVMSELEGNAGFRLEGSLREFAPIQPKSIVFEWPIHRVDRTLDDLGVKGGKGRPRTFTQVELIAALEDGPRKVHEIAEEFGVDSKTVRRRAKTSLGVFAVEKGNIYLVNSAEEKPQKEEKGTGTKTYSKKSVSQKRVPNGNGSYRSTSDPRKGTFNSVQG